MAHQNLQAEQPSGDSGVGKSIQGLLLSGMVYRNLLCQVYLQSTRIVEGLRQAESDNMQKVSILQLATQAQQSKPLATS